MTTILGIDADTLRIAYCTLLAQKGSFTFGKIGIIPRREVKRTCAVPRFAPGYSDNLRGVLYPVLKSGGDVYLEDAFMGRNRRTYGYLSQVQGEIRYEASAVFGAQKLIEIIQPSVWQSVVGKYFDIPFRGELDTKSCAMLCAAKILGFTPNSTHEADAACIAFYGFMQRAYVNHTKQEEKGPVTGKRKTHSG